MEKLTQRQKDIINKAAQKACELNKNDPFCNEPVEFFVEDYTNAMIGKEPDVLGVFYAIASLDMVEEASELTGLSSKILD